MRRNETRFPAMVINPSANAPPPPSLVTPTNPKSIHGGCAIVRVPFEFSTIRSIVSVSYSIAIFVGCLTRCAFPGGREKSSTSTAERASRCSLMNGGCED